MKFDVCLAGGSVLVAMVFSVVSRVAGLGAEREIWFGMLGPTLASVAAWAAIERQRRLNPRNILKRVIQAFVVKFLFFGVYVAVFVKANLVHHPKLFVVCFALFYFALHMAEAVELRRAQAKPAANSDINQ